MLGTAGGVGGLGLGLALLDHVQLLKAGLDLGEVLAPLHQGLSEHLPLLAPKRPVNGGHDDHLLLQLVDLGSDRFSSQH